MSGFRWPGRVRSRIITVSGLRDPAISRARSLALRGAPRAGHGNEEMKQGPYSVATIVACAAPMGRVRSGNVLGIGEAPQSPGAWHEPGRRNGGPCQGVLSESMWPTSIRPRRRNSGTAALRHPEGRLQTFDHEMESASLELLNQLSRFHWGRFSAEPSVKGLTDGPMFGERPFAELSRDKKFGSRCIFLAGTALVLALFAQTLRLSVEATFLYVPLMFGISCLFVYPVWTKLLHRRSGGLAALGAALCFCWTLAELVSGRKLPVKENEAMTGIRFVVDEKGRRVAVQIDLKKHGAIWEDDLGRSGVRIAPEEKECSLRTTPRGWPEAPPLAPGAEMRYRFNDIQMVRIAAAVLQPGMPRSESWVVLTDEYLFRRPQ